MKKLKFFVLSILVIFGAAIFSACKKQEVRVESVDVSDSSISLRAGERVELDVFITPEGASNKQFNIIGNYSDVVTIQADYNNMKLVLVGNNEIIPGRENATIAVRTVDGSYDKIITITLTDEENVAVPQNLSFDGQYLSWDESERATRYTILVNNEPKVINNNRYLLDLEHYNGQDVSVQVKANGKSRNLDSEYSESLDFLVFPKPENVELSVEPAVGANRETKVLSWDAVQGAETYSVLVNNRLIDDVDTNLLDITEYLTEPLRYEIKVRANSIAGQNKFNSAYTGAISVESLSFPNNLTISNGVLRWNTVTSASVKYAVWYTIARNGVLEEQVYTTTNTYWSLPFDIDVGEYSARVGAVGDGTDTLSSDFGEVIRFTKLDSVRNVRIENDAIVWNKVDNANSYIVYFNNVLDDAGQSVTNERLVQLSDADKIAYEIPSELGAGSFKINIQAVGQDDKIPSNFMENDFWAYKLPQPSGIQVSKDENNKSVITWKRVENASGYQVRVERPEDAEYNNIFTVTQSNEEYISISNISNMSDDGNYIITITSLGGKVGDITYLRSNKSDRVEINKLAAPNLIKTRLKDGILAWDRINNAGSYSVMIKSTGNDDILFNVTTTNIDFNSVDYHIDSGVYQIYVKAISKNNQNILDSEYCEHIVVNKLSTKTVIVKNGTIDNLEVDEEENYQYKYEIVDERGRESSVNDIKDYVDNVIASNVKASIKVVAVPKHTEITMDEQTIYYMKSDSSSAIYVKKLPTIEDLAIRDGYLYFGENYIDIFGYEFVLCIDLGEENGSDVNLNTERVYNFNTIEAGSHTANVWAKSIETDDDLIHDEDHPYNLNSKMSAKYSFKKLITPNNLTISSFSDGNTYVMQAMDAADDYGVKTSGAIVWDEVEDAIQYELKFENENVSLYTTELYHTLQNTSIFAGGGKAVKIKAHGNGTNIISSDFCTSALTFTKLYAPDVLSLSVDENGKKYVDWSYSDSSKDPNNGFNMMSLINPNNTFAMFIFVEKVGSNIIYYPATTGLDSVSSNRCQLPNGLSGNSTLRILAVPFNTYITEISLPYIDESKIDKVLDSSLQIVSDYSPELSLSRLQTPLDLKLENQNPEDIDNSRNILSWSKLDYSEGILDEYRIFIKAAKKEGEVTEKIYKFSVSTHDTSFPTIVVDDLSKASNCCWEFNKTNFESLFGADTYVPNVYSVSIQAISKFGAKYNVGDRVVYYIDSYNSTSMLIEILPVPDISVVKGTVSWDKIANAAGYGLTLILPDNSKKFVVAQKEDTTLSLQSDALNNYPAGEYYLDVVALGDGHSTISSESRKVADYRRLIKLEKVENLKIEDGIITYSNHSIVDSAAGENCQFELSIRSSRPNAKPVEEFNGKLHSFELTDENKFPGALGYYISVMASGDNNLYISSDYSEEIYGDKFASPSGLKVIDGKLTWTRVSGVTKYLITVSGGEHLYNATEVTNTYKFDGVEGGTYRVEIQAIGDNLSLNSSVSVLNDVVKLGAVEDFKLVNGYFMWKFAANSNYKLVIDRTREIGIKDSEAEIVNVLGENYVSYNLSDVQLDDEEHIIYVYNYGGSDKISSLPTNSIKIRKLGTPTQLLIDKDTFKFKGVENASNYAIKTIVTPRSAPNNSTEIVFIPESIDAYEVSGGYYSIAFSILQEQISQGVSLNSENRYDICVYAVGVSPESLDESATYYIASNDSESIVIEQPGSPILSYETDSSGIFFGKITWSEVADADYYKVFVKASEVNHQVLFGHEIDLSSANPYNVVQDEESPYYGYSMYVVTDKTYANIAYTDSDYNFIVVASKNKNGFDSFDSNKLSNLEYNIFYSELDENQDGLTDATAYQIANEIEYGYIKYNLEAHYKLTSNIAFVNVPQTIGLVIPFTGTFDGDNHTLQGKSGDEIVNLYVDSDTFDGLFGVIGEGGVVKNIVINADIYSTKIIDNIINIAYVARENYGTIDNIKTTGIIGTEYNSDTYMICAASIAIYNYGTINYCVSSVSVSAKNNLKDVYAAGIAVYNYGTVSKTGFTGNVTGQIAAGIVGQNFARISECYFEGNGENTFILSRNNGVTDNYAAGIAAYMQGEDSVIEYCYSNGKITGTTISSKIAYVGGLVGYLKSGSLKNSYAIGCKNNEAIITATGNELNTIKVGVVVGATETRNINGTKVVYVSLGTQNYSGSGTLLNTTGVSLSNLSNTFDTSALQLYYDVSGTYPKLKNAKKN